MSTLRHRFFHPFAWLAFLAMLALGLLPTVSRAMAFAQGTDGRWAEVCTAQGASRLVVDDAAPPAGVAATDHCPFCALSAGGMAPPPGALPVPGARAGALPVPVPVGVDPRAPSALAASQPRAPPRLR